jgi:SAM-dependent methyltransferase/ribosomal protein S18 acetylase RimI-like enzyme
VTVETRASVSPADQIPAGFDRVRGIVRTEGYGALLRRIVRRGVAPIVQISTIHFFVRELGENIASPSPVPGVFVRDGELSDLSTHAEGFDPSQSRESLTERLKKGHRFVIAITADGSAAHTRWLSTRSAHVPEIGLDVALGPGEAYFYNGYTRPDCRIRGIDGLVRSYIFERLQADGFRRVYSYVRGNNRAGMKAATRWQEPAGGLRSLRLFGVQRPLLSFRSYRGPSLVPAVELATKEEASRRSKEWQAWFESWLEKPLSMRSTGHSSLPPEYFSSTADYVCSTLELDSEPGLVLDLGCDSAMITRLVAPRCQRLLGIDLIPGLLAAGVKMALRAASGGPVTFLAADGTLLPLRSGTVAKAYCCGVLQTLPSREHGVAMIEELVRVVRPGGVVLVGAVPDLAKRADARKEVFFRSSFASRLRLLASLALPRGAKSRLRSILGYPPAEPLVILDYDLSGLAKRLESQGLECRVLDFPPEYWSRDFRRTRSNLWIGVPDR